jgi:hypothetical protein
MLSAPKQEIFCSKDKIWILGKKDPFGLLLNFAHLGYLKLAIFRMSILRIDHCGGGAGGG